MEICEDIRHTLEMKDLYAQRKETIERLFGTAKENQWFPIYADVWKSPDGDEGRADFACMNLKKLAKIKEKRGLLGGRIPAFSIGMQLHDEREMALEI